jgi:hypothetical protein
MTTRTREAPSRPAVRPGRAVLARFGGWVAAGMIAGAVGVGTIAYYLWIYRTKAFTVPIGWDTSRYLWRTTMAQAVGIAGMEDAVPSFVNADPARPAFPVIASTLSSLWGISPFRIAAVLPPVAAAIIGLAAGSFVGSILRRPSWEVAAVAVGVGTSAFVVRLLGPETYQDNLFAAAVFMAAATPLAMSALQREAAIPAALLLGAGGVVHWAFFVFMLATVLLMGVAYGPASWRAWRSGTSGLLGTASARLAGVGAGAAAVAASTVYGVLGTTTRSPRLSEREFARKLRLDLHTYGFPITLPLAAGGAASLAFGSKAERRRGDRPVEAEDGARGERHGRWRPADGTQRDRAALVLLLAWCAVALAGYIGLEVFSLKIPAHRFLAFALAVPVLAVVGVLRLGGIVARFSRPLGASLVLLILGIGAWASHTEWFRNEPWIDPERTRQAATAGAYLEAAGLDPERPVVFIVNDVDASFVALMTHMIRSVLPAERIEQAYFYAGSPEDYLARRPTPVPPGAHGSLSRSYFSNMVETYDRNPVALVLAFYNEDRYNAWVRSHPGTVVGPQVAVVSGPILSEPVPAVPGPAGPYRIATLALLAVASLGVLWVVGLGWSVVLVRRWLSPLGLVAVAPAIGIAALVVGGVVVDRAGVRLTGIGGAVTPLGIALAGWVVAVASARRPGRSSDPRA